MEFSDIESVVHLSKEGSYLKACKMYYDIMHNCITDQTFQHPNTYFNCSCKQFENIYSGNYYHKILHTVINLWFTYPKKFNCCRYRRLTNIIIIKEINKRNKMNEGLQEMVQLFLIIRYILLFQQTLTGS